MSGLTYSIEAWTNKLTEIIKWQKRTDSGNSASTSQTEGTEGKRTVDCKSPVPVVRKVRG